MPRARTRDCPACAYDLAGAPLDGQQVRCPECGGVFLAAQLGLFEQFPSPPRALAMTCWPQLVAAPMTAFAPGAVQLLALASSLFLLSRLYGLRRPPRSVWASGWVLLPLVLAVNGVLAMASLWAMVAVLGWY